ncbi:hypothetical protein PCL_05170 [Purpureocillium lilacinum]|uniref:Uncharacterized protein n=1 Tax=Purpureocillium lilacinum TaxID=33203 RepID=A0A2U3DW57_PURLI|nr:hypothetical protein PCL_05170 [Purpureocillium lilacinum]
MAWELEGLIAHLLMLIACAGEQAPTSSGSSAAEQPVVDRATETIWKWLVQRSDVSVGRERQHNHLALPALLDLQQIRIASGPDTDGAASSSSPDHAVRIYVSEATMWEAITGHAVDHKRIPRSEWVLLLGIASSGPRGILQGDLGRLVVQDKRSVPKRTDSLVRKGYIIKRTTLVRGTKTSKMWLKHLAPSLPKESDSISRPVPEMTLTRQALADNLDPVPWHIRWTGTDVDYTALATTIMAIAKEWEVIRMQDLKAKLGILEMRWQMKVMSKTCRFLGSRGTIQYVAAKLENKVFKDCIKFCRELDAEDWFLFLATGKKAGRPSRNAAEDDMGDEDIARRASSLRLSSLPPWAPDKPLPWTIARLVQASRDNGLSNPDIYSLTLGATFNRFLSAMTGSMATTGLQPAHLRHMQLRSEHARSGKVASYLFFPQTKANEAPLQSVNVEETPVEDAQGYRFGPPPKVPMKTSTQLSLARICGVRLKAKKPSRSTQRTTPSGESQGSQDEVRPETPADTATAQAENERPKLVVKLMVSPEALRAALTLEIPPPSPAPDGRADEPQNEADKELTSQPEAVGDVTEHATDVATSPSVAARGRGSGRARGRPRGRGRGKRGRGGQSTGSVREDEPPSRPWTCEKCGGSWKNDLGLKYHLEKSRSSCNTSYVPPAVPAGRRTKAKASSYSTTLEAFYESDSVRGEGTPDASAPSVSDEPLAPRTRIKRRQSPEELLDSRPATNDDAAEGSHTTPMAPLKNLTTLVEEQGPFVPAKTGQGALLETEASLPRHNLALMSNSPLSAPVHAYPPTPSDFVSQIGQPEGSGSVSATPGLEAESTMTGRENKRGDGSHHRRNRTTKVMLNRISNIIENLLEERGGALLGGSTLAQDVASSWNARFPAEQTPSERDCQTTARDMIKRKAVAEHWHAFRDEKGMFSKCQLITRPNLDAFAPESLRLIEQLKMGDGPFRNTMVGQDKKPDLDASAGTKIRGRRPLPEEVAILDAPVYAAQLAAKRAGDAESPRRVKRYKYSVDPKSEEGNGLGTPPRRRRGRKRKIGHGEWDDGFSSPSYGTQASTRGITFLEPNTRLDDDFAPQASTARGDTPWSLGPFTSRRGQESAELQASGPTTYKFGAATPIVGCRGTWPWFSNAGIDSLGSSLILEGWMPDRKWFEWSAINHQIEERLAASKHKKYTPGLANTPHQRFLRRLRACLDVELSHESHFVKAAPGEAGPYNIFVRFHADPDEGVTGALHELVWPAKEQLTPNSVRDGLASKADDAASSSSDDDLEIITRRAIASQARASAADAGSWGSRQPKIKRVALVTRALTALSTPGGTAEVASTGTAKIDNRPELLAAFIAIRSVLGGADKAVDWGLLMKLYPHLGLVHLRRFWTAVRKEQTAYVSNFTRIFQEKLLSAFESGELPVIDFDKPLEYDWSGLIRWTMQLPRQDGFQMPRSRELLDQHYSLDGVQGKTEDWRERYFHTLTSTYTRFEAITMDSGAVTITSASNGAVAWPALAVTDFDVAKSWVKSLCSTGETRYSSDQIKTKFNQLCPGNRQQRAAIFRQATSQLTDQKVICRSKKALLGGRPYRLNEWYVSNLAKMAQTAKYDEAAAFKAQLDDAFRSQGSMAVAYTLSEGAVMALTNLNGAGRVRLVPVGLPDIPLGFEPGNYESRKYPKSYYHFGIDAVPTESYKFNEEIDVLRVALADGPPTGRSGGELPQWVDFFEASNVQLWSEILGAFCFAFAIRGAMTREGICRALHPTLDEFEAQLIMDWGRRTGVLVSTMDGMATTVGEWWWLVVPWLRNGLAA